MPQFTSSASAHEQLQLVTEGTRRKRAAKAQSVAITSVAEALEWFTPQAHAAWYHAPEWQRQAWLYAFIDELEASDEQGIAPDTLKRRLPFPINLATSSSSSVLASAIDALSSALGLSAGPEQACRDGWSFAPRPIALPAKASLRTLLKHTTEAAQLQAAAAEQRQRQRERLASSSRSVHLQRGFTSHMDSAAAPVWQGRASKSQPVSIASSMLSSRSSSSAGSVYGHSSSCSSGSSFAV